MRLDPVPNADVIIGEALFGDARFRPQNAIGMGEVDRRYGLTWLRIADTPGALAHDLLRRLVLSQAFERRLTNLPAGGPAAKRHFHHMFRLDEPRIAPRLGLQRLGKGR